MYINFERGDDLGFIAIEIKKLSKNWQSKGILR